MRHLIVGCGHVLIVGDLSARMASMSDLLGCDIFDHKQLQLQRPLLYLWTTVVATRLWRHVLGQWHQIQMSTNRPQMIGA